MMVGVAIVEVRVHGSHSLKQKRGVVRSIVQRVRNRFNVSVSEVGGQDTWQRVELGIASVGSDRANVRGRVDRAVEFIEELHLAEVVSVDVEVLDLPHETADWEDADWTVSGS